MSSIHEALNQVWDYFHERVEVTVEGLPEAIEIGGEFEATFRITNTAHEVAETEIRSTWLSYIIFTVRGTAFATPLDEHGEPVERVLYNPVDTRPLDAGESCAVTVRFRAVGAQPNVVIARSKVSFKGGTLFVQQGVHDPPEPFAKTEFAILNSFWLQPDLLDDQEFEAQIVGEKFLPRGTLIPAPPRRSSIPH
jgi:hypothetical protein